MCLSQNLFAAKSHYICVMANDSYFTVEGHVWTRKYYFNIPNTKSLANVT